MRDIVQLSKMETKFRFCSLCYAMKGAMLHCPTSTNPQSRNTKNRGLYRCGALPGFFVILLKMWLTHFRHSSFLALTIGKHNVALDCVYFSPHLTLVIYGAFTHYFLINSVIPLEIRNMLSPAFRNFISGQFLKKN